MCRLHNFTKFIAKIAKRVFVLRDTDRFHHFKDGFCSSALFGAYLYSALIRMQCVFLLLLYYSFCLLKEMKLGKHH